MPTAQEWLDSLAKWYPNPDHVVYKIVEDLRKLEETLAPKETYNEYWDD